MLASKKHGLAFQKAEPVSGRPWLAFGKPRGGMDGQTDRWMDGQRDVQIPPVFYKTSSPLVPLGAIAEKVVSLARKRLWAIKGMLEPHGGWSRPQWKSKAPQGLVLITSWLI